MLHQRGVNVKCYQWLQLKGKKKCTVGHVFPPTKKGQVAKKGVIWQQQKQHLLGSLMLILA